MSFLVGSLRRAVSADVDAVMSERWVSPHRVSSHSYSPGLDRLLVVKDLHAGAGHHAQQGDGGRVVDNDVPSPVEQVNLVKDCPS